jgi:hypothetical protein
LNKLLKPHDHPIISSLDELQNTFAFFFNKGHAAERFVSNREDFDKIIDYSLEMPQQVKKQLIGFARLFDLLTKFFK